jgi:hypothetical protein
MLLTRKALENGKDRHITPFLAMTPQCLSSRAKRGDLLLPSLAFFIPLD